MVGYLAFTYGPRFFTEGMVHLGSQSIVAEGILEKMREMGPLSTMFSLLQTTLMTTPSLSCTAADHIEPPRAAVQSLQPRTC